MEIFLIGIVRFSEIFLCRGRIGMGIACVKFLGQQILVQRWPKPR